MADGSTRPRLPPNQALLPARRWPVVGEDAPRASDAPWTVSIGGRVRIPVSWTLEELKGRALRDFTLDIHCVTRWSKYDARFTGIPLADLLAEAGPLPDARFLSFRARSDRGHSTSLALADALDLGAIVAFAYGGEPLAAEHGGPVRMVVPGRYFYKSVKWLEAIEVLAEDRLGYWEAESGYHNNADPWREERYIAANVKKLELRRLIQARDFSGRDLLSMAADRMELKGLKAAGALLRNASFLRADLEGADFTGANLSNAHMQGAHLSGATFLDADLEGADFRGCDLRDADFRGASLFGVSFTDEPDAPSDWPGAAIAPGTRIDRRQLDALSDTQKDYVMRALDVREA